MSSLNEAIFMEYIQLVSKKYGIPEEDLINISNETKPEVQDFSKMTVSQLKKICTSLGLKKQSTKPKLIQTLEDHYRQHPAMISSNPPTIENNDDNIIIIQDKKKVVPTEEEDDIDDSDTSFDDTFILDDDDDDCVDPDMMD